MNASTAASTPAQPSALELGIDMRGADPPDDDEVRADAARRREIGARTLVGAATLRAAVAGAWRTAGWTLTCRADAAVGAIVAPLVAVETADGASETRERVAPTPA